MNRRQRRTAAVQTSKLSRPAQYLDLHCVGPFSEPRQDCDKHISVKMPFDGEQLRLTMWANYGWFLTLASGPDEEQMRLQVLCDTCASAILPPELLSEAIRVMPGRA